jgi:hypothetical protein
MQVAVVRDADRLAHRDVGLGQYPDGIDHEGIVFPMPDRMTVERRIGIVRVSAAVRVDAPQPVAIRLAEDRDAARRE